MFSRRVAPDIEFRLFDMGDAEAIFDVVPAQPLVPAAVAAMGGFHVVGRKTSGALSDACASSSPGATGATVRHLDRWDICGFGGLPSDRLAQPELQHRLLDRGAVSGQGNHDALLREHAGLPLRRLGLAPGDDPVRGRQPAELRHSRAPGLHAGRCDARGRVGQRPLAGSGVSGACWSTTGEHDEKADGAGQHFGFWVQASTRSSAATVAASSFAPGGRMSAHSITPRRRSTSLRIAMPSPS